MNDDLLTFLRTEYPVASYPKDEWSLGDLLAKFVTDYEGGSWQYVLQVRYCPSNMADLKTPITPGG